MNDSEIKTEPKSQRPYMSRSALAHSPRHVWCGSLLTLEKQMKTSDSKIVADGMGRIHDSEGFRIREEEIKSQLIQSRQGEVSSAGWLRRRLILWRIHILASKMAQKELCPSEALYLRTK